MEKIKLNYDCFIGIPIDKITLNKNLEKKSIDLKKIFQFSFSKNPYFEVAALAKHSKVREEFLIPDIYPVTAYPENENSNVSHLGFYVENWEKDLFVSDYCDMLEDILIKDNSILFNKNEIEILFFVGKVEVTF